MIGIFNSATRHTFATATILCVVAGGCGNSQTGIKRTLGETHVGALATLYYRYQGENQGYPPKDEAEFRGFVASQDWILDYANVASHDALYVSEADNQAITICLGKKKLEIDGARVICYEATAVEGKRLVGFGGGSASFIDESAFAASIGK